MLAISLWTPFCLAPPRSLRQSLSESALVFFVIFPYGHIFRVKLSFLILPRLLYLLTQVSNKHFVLIFVIRFEM